jgi:hypothetical protein
MPAVVELGGDILAKIWGTLVKKFAGAFTDPKEYAPNHATI